MDAGDRTLTKQTLIFATVVDHRGRIQRVRCRTWAGKARLEVLNRRQVLGWLGWPPEPRGESYTEKLSDLATLLQAVRS